MSAVVPSREVLLEIHRRMLRIRRFEEAAIRLHKRGEIPGPIHTSIGQEATVVGACLAVRPDDPMTGYHRSHGHPIAKGAAIGPLMAELLGRSTGVCKGKGGSMHLADFGVGSLGESGIVGAAIPIATGAGLSAQRRRTDQVTLCFFGDGAANQGTFHESLNMAALWRLPVVYVCENNQYAATTPFASSCSVPRIAIRAVAYGIEAATVDGQDPLAVLHAVAVAVDRARAGRGPTLVEALTYRFREHAEGLRMGPYREADEVAEWETRDPVSLFRTTLLDGGHADAATLDALDAEVTAEVAAAVAFAQAGPVPDPAAAYDDVWATPLATGAEPPRPADGHSITYLAAAGEAILEEMRRDERVILIGEDIALYGGGAAVAEFGDRIRSTPISENSFTGMGVGAAMTGLRPIVELTIASFVYLAADQIINQAAKLRAMTGGQATVPVVFRASMWHNGSNAAHHSDRPYPMFMNTPGLKVVAPASAFDLKGLLKAAVRDDDPVVVLEDNDLWLRAEPVPDDDYVVPIGVAAVRRTGTDVTVVAISGANRAAGAAAERLAEDGIDVELVDPRTLVPLDLPTIVASVEKTGRLVVVDPAHVVCSAASEITASVAERAWTSLRAAPVRVATPMVPIPFAPSMEKPLYPTVDRIVEAVRQVLGAGAGAGAG